jgi:CPA2 family monovalent cation:H+ antiporter-2
MPHDVTLITTLAAAFGLALLLGFVAVRLRLPALVGYLAAGIMIGPATPGFVADLELSRELAEIGVILLMFGVGLHFSLGDLLAVRRIALPGAIAQIGAATALGFGVASLWGWTAGAGAELPMTTDLKLLSGHVLLVGYGRVGRRIGEALLARGISIVVAEENRETVERLRARGVPAVSGDAAEPAVLIQAHVARARMLVIATPDSARAHAMIDTAFALNPGIDIVARTHSDEDAERLRRDKVARVFMGEHELAAGMTGYVLERMAEPRPAGR